MGLKFFVDHCVPSSVIQAMRDAGHQVLRLNEHIPQDSSDLVVISKAREPDAILVSLNGDFADIVTYPPRGWNGIIALQVRNHPQAISEIVDRLLIYLSSHTEMSQYRGRLLLVEAHRIRIRD
jgi:predicted nuclease of predicted toxin-antitoxin system